ncbi:PREDICTED: U-box domain-containing protein 16-like isoform X2 [Camelina sativa]|uniref:RING-type E3 ubiquitin transferase n=1 Tax=Camelina sativa TaxID=90675 RepID=A0ABM0XSS0_CAMSA|nr:PREDICTED: U-box domain-containing protein 16-like isoform X1 [Camelina sativa]XP_010490503.1 PREDICTED: U-box domain-containing protein 16-like isoform X2 [Camelina sativa]
MAVVDAFPARKRRPLLVVDSPKLSSSDAKLTRSLFLASHEISSMLPLPFFLRRNSLSLIRKVQILSSVFDELLRSQSSSNYSQSALLCFEEMLLVMHRIKSLIDDCSRASRLWLLLQIDVVSFSFHELVADLSTVLDILPVHDLLFSDDAQDLISLLRKQCSHSMMIQFVDPRDDALRRKVTDTIDAIKHHQISPHHSTLTAIFNDLGFTDSASLTDEIQRLEDEIHDHIDDRSKSSAASLIGLVRYSKCVLFGPSSTQPSPPDFRRHKSLSDANIPADFRCPITLELMRHPVVISTGQTYDRESIDLWIQSGHSTCPKTGQVLKHTSLIPNRALKNLIVLWCRDQKIPFELSGDAGAPCNEAAAEFTKMMVEFLIEKLSAADKNGVVFELRALAKSDTVARACIAEAGAIPKLVRYLGTECPSLQINAVTTILNLSILEQNKTRIMETDGALNGVIEVLRSGATWEAKANAAATLFSLAGVSAYRRRLGRKARVVSGLVDLAKRGPTSSKRDALVAILNLVAERENVGRFVEAGVVEAAGDAFRELPEEAVSVVEAVVRRGGLMAVSAAFSLIRLLGEVMREGAETTRESAAATLVTMCRKGGSELVAEMAAIPGIERVIWEMIGAGTARGGRKAASLMRYLRRWAAGDTHHETTTPETHSIVVPTPSRIFTPVL